MHNISLEYDEKDSNILDGHSDMQYCAERVFRFVYVRDEDPDPVGSGDFWPAGSGAGTFFNGSGSGSYL